MKSRRRAKDIDGEKTNAVKFCLERANTKAWKSKLDIISSKSFSTPVSLLQHKKQEISKVEEESSYLSSSMSSFDSDLKPGGYIDMIKRITTKIKEGK